MKSKRKIEDLSISQINQFLLAKYETNNTIINNASIETYNLKKSYGEKILSFFNILLAAALLSSFILYNLDDSSVCVSKLYLFFLAFIILLILLIYTLTVIIKYKTQYDRQIIYRDINNELSIIKNKSFVFFQGTAEVGKERNISYATLSAFLHVIYMICKNKNKSNLIKIFFDWPGVFLAFFFIFVLLIILLIWLLIGGIK
ncbi:MAG: hypothetical protein IJW32_04615 [Clostridia bacterium]|nr:hypothetical protein [Clostridia bacterium]